MNKIKYIHICFLGLSVRLFYLLSTYFLNISPTDCCDWTRYDELSTEILLGNYNMDGGAFIVAPIFPIIVAFAKIVSYENSILIVQLFQILISTLSIFFLMKLSDLIFENKSISIILGLIFSFYPFTFWFVIYMGQETIFQSLLIISFYYLLKFNKYEKIKDLIFFSIIFSLTIHTKSHVVLFIPFIFIILLLNCKSINITLKNFFIFSFILFFLSLPQSINNKNYNGYHILATTGVGYHFLVGHNDEFYKMLTDPPERGSEEYNKIWGMDYEVMRKTREKNNNLNHRELDKVRVSEGINWILDNPYKATNLFFINIKNFIQPGFNRLHHADLKWLISFLISLPIYILAYYGIFRNVKHDYKKHTLIICLFLMMLAFSSIFFTQNRFRVITLEPFYLIYASYSINKIYQYLRTKKII